MKKFLLTLLGVALASTSWASSGAYDYPLPDPYAATVIGTPPEYEVPLPEKIRLKMLEREHSTKIGQITFSACTEDAKLFNMFHLPAL